MLTQKGKNFLASSLKFYFRTITSKQSNLNYFLSQPNHKQPFKNIFSSTITSKISFPFSTTSSPVAQLQKQLNVVKNQKGDNSMQYLQKLHQLSFAQAKNNNIQKAIEHYKLIVQKFQQNIEDKMSPAVGDTLKNLQILLKRGGRLMQFIPLTLKLIDIRVKQLGPDHKIVANQHNQLGVAYFHIQNFDEALNQYQLALKIRQNIFGNNSLEVIQINNNIATAYYSQGQFPKAKIIFEENIKKLKAAPNFTQKMLITPMTNLTAIMQHEGNHQQALTKYEEIIQILKRVQTKNTYFLANIYHSMGIVCLKMNNINKAQQYHQLSLKINQQLYGENHPSIAQNYHNLGVCYQTKGQYQKSLEVYKKSVQIKKNTLGENHPSLAETFNNMGIVYKFMGNNDQARKMYQDSLQVLKTQNSQVTSNPIYGDMHMNIGTTYLDGGNAQKAVQNFNQAERIFKIFFDENHQKIADLYFNKAKIQFMFTKDFAKSRQYLEKSISSYEKFAPQNPNLYIKYSMRGSCFFEERKFNDAAQSYKKSFDSLQKNAKGHPEQLIANTGLLNYQIGASYFELKQFIKAQQSLSIAIDVFEKNFGKAYETLIELYFMLGNIEKALGNKQKSQDNFKKADKSMQQLLKQAPDHPLLIKKQQQIRNCIQK